VSRHKVAATARDDTNLESLAEAYPESALVLPLDLHALVGEVDRVLRRANVALAVHLTRAGFEERRPPTEQHWREVDATKVKRIPSSRSRRTSCGGAWVTTKNGGVPV
jgi:hypothetical protein